ncbi:MAG: ABC transporter permease [Verrucomicrobia bacterium]|nr:ABC transporter permease [Verrucomicrobiota bacterium]MBV9672437.1 ABC transporter permease [Verrucomicrobiota bacterium]
MNNPAVITAREAGSRQRSSHLIQSIFSKYGIFLIFAAMVLVASILSPAFVSSTNLINIVRQMSVVGLIALGVTGVIVSAGIDLSSGSVVGLTAVVAASLAQDPEYSTPFYHGLHVPLIVPVLAACLVGALIGLINGSLVAKAKIPPFIATLGTYTAVRGAAMLYTSGRPISDLTDQYNFIGQGDIFGIPVPIVILVVMAVITHILYARTKFGKYVYAIGGNEQAARVSGINTGLYKMLIYVYAAFLAGIAGLVVSSRIGSGQPGLGVGYELDAIAAAVIGGTSLSAGGIGTVAGTIVGALIIGVLNNILDLMNVSAYWQQIIKGCIIVGAVIIDQLKHRGSK